MMYLPTLSDEEMSRDQILNQERAQKILSYLRKYEYASFEHVVFELIWHTGMRRGATHGLDLRDYISDEQYVDLNHRPESETHLKSDKKGERPVALSKEVCRVLDD